MAIVFQPNAVLHGQELGTSLAKSLIDARTQESVQQARNVAAEHQINLKNAYEILRTYGADEQTITPDGRVVGKDGRPVDPQAVLWRNQLTEWAANYIQHSGPTQVWRGWKDSHGDWITGRQGHIGNIPKPKNRSNTEVLGNTGTGAIKLPRTKNPFDTN